MKVIHWLQIICWPLICFFCSPQVGSGQVLPGQTDQLSDSSCQLDMVPSDELRLDSQVAWKIVSANRVLASGKSGLKQKVPRLENDRVSIQFEFRTPQVNPGIVLKAEMVFQVGDEKKESVHSIRIRSGDPFAAIQKTLQQSGIALIDPSQETAEALDALQFPSDRLPSLRSVSGQSIVLLGENTQWNEGQWKEMELLARDGKWVIVLRPHEDSVSVWTNTGHDRSKLAFGHWSESEWFPKGLDSHYWELDHETSPGLEVSFRSKEILLSANKGPQVWQFAMYQSKSGAGGCLIVGVPVVSCWNASPVPRELLAHILTRCIENRSKTIPSR